MEEVRRTGFYPLTVCRLSFFLLKDESKTVLGSSRVILLSAATPSQCHHSSVLRDISLAGDFSLK
jgi:hypothetical protein